MDKIDLKISNNCARCTKYIDEIDVKLRKIITSDSGRFDKYCNNCIHGNAGIKDVWYGYGSGTHTEENICDPASGQPIPFSSKQQKWEAMQKARICEVGDTVHGARSTFTK